MNREEIRTLLNELGAEHISSVCVWADPPDAPTRWFARGPAAPELHEIDHETYDVLREHHHATRAGHEQQIDVYAPGLSVYVQCAGARSAERCGLWLPCTEGERVCLCGSPYSVVAESWADPVHAAKRGPLVSVCTACGKSDGVVEDGSGKSPHAPQRLVTKRPVTQRLNAAPLSDEPPPAAAKVPPPRPETVCTTFTICETCSKTDARIARARDIWSSG